MRQNLFRNCYGIITKTAVSFNHTFRYIDDVPSINNHNFHNHVHLIHPDELKIKNTTESDQYILLCPPPFRRRGAYCFAPVGRSVGRSVCRSVGRPDDVRSISWELFVRLLWYFICGLVMRRGRSLFILRSIGQRSRSFKLEIGIFCPLIILRTFC
jgi:hypothetical protein